MKKILHLLKENFYQILRNEKATFLLILAGMVIGYTTFILVSGVLNYQMKIQASSSSYNSISILFNENESNENEIKSFFDEKPLGELYNALLIDLGDEETNVIGWKGIDFTRWHALDPGGKFFTLDQSETDENIVIISDNLSEPGAEAFIYKENKYYIINQSFLAFQMFVKELPVEIDYYTDKSGRSDTVIMPYNTFFKNGFHTDILRIDLVESIHIDEEFNMEKLQSYFKGQKIFFSDNVYQDEEEIRRAALVRLLFAGLCILALINIFSLFNYWINNNKKQYFIYAFCGASNVITFTLIAVEWLIINIISFLFGVVLVLLIRTPLNRLDVTIHISITENIVLLGIGYILSFLFSLKTVFRVSNVMNTFDKRSNI